MAVNALKDKARRALYAIENFKILNNQFQFGVKSLIVGFIP